MTNFKNFLLENHPKIKELIQKFNGEKKGSKSIKIIIKSKDRVKTREEVEKFLKKNNIPFVRKDTSDSSFSVTSIVGLDKSHTIIYKPAPGALKAPNKGIQFENELYRDLVNWQEGIPDIKHPDFVDDFSKMLGKTEKIIDISLDGGLNQSRPLKISPNQIIVGELGNIGKTVTDITVTTNKKKYYLSLKYGNTVTFVNAGVGKILGEKDLITGDVTNPKGRALLEMFSIDTKKFADIFNNYTGRGSGKEIVNITSDLKNNKLFKTFMQSVIGYGYILVHKKGNDVYTLEMTKQIRDNFIKVNKAEILYPKNGSAKRIDIKISMNGMDIKVNIRNKQGKIYPSHIMADYIIKH